MISDRTIKLILKGSGIALAIVVGGMLAIVGVVEFQQRKSLRQVEAMVRELAPGTPYQQALDRLGPPMQVIVEREEMLSFNRFNGPSGGRDIAGEKLHVFMDRRLPFRFVLVFTDEESRTIRQASWESM